VYDALRKLAVAAGAGSFAASRGPATGSDATSPASAQAIVPPERTRYLAEIAETVRGYHARTQELAELAADAEAFAHALIALGEPAPSLMDRRAPAAPRTAVASEPPGGTQSSVAADVPDVLRAHFTEAANRLPLELRRALAEWPDVRARYQADEQSYAVRGREIRVRNHVETLASTRVPRVAVPSTRSLRELTRYLRAENLPGAFPFSAGVFPFKRREEDPARMFAGEGGPERTNRRFHLLAQGQPAVRLSTAFDSVTLYGRDPHERPDIWGKVGNAGVSVCTLDDAKKLYSGFDLIDPKTSVSMTINGPAPTVLAFFLNAAIDQQVEAHLRAQGQLEAVRARLGGASLPSYAGALPASHDGRGLGLLGIPGPLAVDAETYAKIAGDVLRRVRGTVQADILKEDQAQNTCIFSTGFALKLMGDIQSYFIDHAVSNFYSVSVSGYHIAEAGANPVTQLAFTLANAFTYVEHYLSRGMKLDDFAPNLSFFFSSSLDAESSVLGRVARRIWAIALRDRYGAGERSQKLKYHSQTSGRSLHAQEMSFNDIRTTLQAQAALFDHCNSLHTNAYDEAVTTPTAESVRRALAIQLIIQRELGIAQNENPLQGSYVIEQLTAAVEEAVLCELERLSERGGVLGAMEMLYQRSKIQEESLHYEALKHSGELPLIGVNTFENPDAEAASQRPSEVARSNDAERRAQLDALHAFQARWAEQTEPALDRLRAAASRGENVFAELMNAVRYASLGQITDALFAVGGAYRRAM
jgi:methylmalonyl-CoA mutase